MQRAIFAFFVALTWAVPASAADDTHVFAALDAVGPLDGHKYDPRPVIRAVNMLQPLGHQAGVALLRRYLAKHGRALHARPPRALFVVLRTLFAPPPASGSPPTDACTPAQRDFAAGGCLRPPRLGAPHPPAPKDLRSLRYPAFILGDVPLSLVSGYMLGGQPEPLSMHLDSLNKYAYWRTSMLHPKSAGAVRYLFMHYGGWPLNSQVGKMVEAQLKRIERPVQLPCVRVGLHCLPQSAKSTQEITASFGLAPPPPVVELKGGDKRLFIAFLEVPTDSESYIDVAGWSYSAHFSEWRLFSTQLVYDAVTLKAAIDAKRGVLVLTDARGRESVVVPLGNIPHSAKR